MSGYVFAGLVLAAGLALAGILARRDKQPFCQECEGCGHTSTFSRDGYVTCDWCGGSGQEPWPLESDGIEFDRWETEFGKDWES